MRLSSQITRLWTELIAGQVGDREGCCNRVSWSSDLFDKGTLECLFSLSNLEYTDY